MLISYQTYSKASKSHINQCVQSSTYFLNLHSWGWCSYSCYKIIVSITYVTLLAFQMYIHFGLVGWLRRPTAVPVTKAWRQAAIVAFGCVLRWDSTQLCARGVARTDWKQWSPKCEDTATITKSQHSVTAMLLAYKHINQSVKGNVIGLMKTQTNYIALPIVQPSIHPSVR